MIVNELAEIVLIPFSSMIAEGIWEVIEETKLYLIPFILIAWASANEARSAGDEAGAPAIQVFRKIEARYIAMFIVMIFAGKPVSFQQSTNDIGYKTFSCTKDGIGITNLSESSVKEIANSTVGVFRTTLWSGLVNIFSTGVTNASIASIPCKTGSYRKALSNVAVAESESAAVTDLIKIYDESCYKKAVDRLSKFTLLNPNTRDKYTDLSFNGFAVQQMFPGISASGMNSALTMEVTKDIYPITSSDTGTGFVTTKYVKECSVVGEHIEKQLRHDVQSGASAASFLRISSSDNLTEAELTKYTNIIYDNTVRNSASWWSNMFSSSGNDTIAAEVASKEADEGYLAPLLSSLRNVVGGAAMTLGAAFESVKIIQYQQALPIIVAAIKTALIAAIPIMLLLSGFNGRVLLTITIGYFALEYSKFFLELGITLDETVTALILGMGDLNNINNPTEVIQASGLLLYLSFAIQYSLVGAWVVFVGWLGVKMHGVFQTADGAANTGAQMSDAVIKAAVSGGKSLAGKFKSGDKDGG